MFVAQTLCQTEPSQNLHKICLSYYVYLSNLLHIFVKVVTYISCPLPNQKRLKFDQVVRWMSNYDTYLSSCCKHVNLNFLPSAKPDQIEVWPRFASFMKFLLVLLNRKDSSLDLVCCLCNSSRPVTKLFIFANNDFVMTKLKSKKRLLTKSNHSIKLKHSIPGSVVSLKLLNVKLIHMWVTMHISYYYTWVLKTRLIIRKKKQKFHLGQSIVKSEFWGHHSH